MRSYNLLTKIHVLCEFGQNKFRCLNPRAGHGHRDVRTFYKTNLYSGFRGPQNGYFKTKVSIVHVRKLTKRFVKFGLQSMIKYLIIDFIDGIFIAH